MFDKEKMEEEMRKWSWGGEGSEEEGAICGWSGVVPMSRMNIHVLFNTFFFFSSVPPTIIIYEFQYM